MSRYELTLNNGETVELDTRLTIKRMMIIQEEHKFSTSFLNTVMGMTVGQSVTQDMFKMEDLLVAPYIAYRNANLANALTQEEFTDLVDFDLMMCVELLTDIIGMGQNKGFSSGFRKKTVKLKETKKNEVD